MRDRCWLILVLLLLAGSTAIAQAPEPSAQETPKPDEQISVTDRDVADVPGVHAKEDCPNWAWAAAVQAVLASDGVVEFDQEYWMDKLYGGTICLDSAGDPEKLAKTMEGEYVLDDGKHVQISATYTAGLPANASDLLVPLSYNRLQIVFLNGKAMLFTGASWEDVAKPRGDRTVRVKELRFDDVTQPPGKRRVVLNPESDDLSQVNGVFRINVAVMETRN